MAREPEQVLHRHVEPLGVVADLEVLVVRPQHLGRLAPVGLRVRVDLLARQHRPRDRAARRVPHARGVVAHDQHDDVAGVLELAQLRQHHGVAEVEVGRRRVQAELDAQRTALREALREAVAGQAVDRVAGQVRRGRAASERGSSIRANANVSPSRGRSPRWFETRPEAAAPHSQWVRAARRTVGSSPGTMSESERDIHGPDGDLATRTPPDGEPAVPDPYAHHAFGADEPPAQPPNGRRARRAEPAPSGPPEQPSMLHEEPARAASGSASCACSASCSASASSRSSRPSSG